METYDKRKEIKVEGQKIKRKKFIQSTTSTEIQTQATPIQLGMEAQDKAVRIECIRKQ